MRNESAHQCTHNTNMSKYKIAYSRAITELSPYMHLIVMHSFFEPDSRGQMVREF